MGVATAAPGVNLDELVHQADVAMYAAKAHGKGQVQLYQPGLLQSETALVSFERQLGRAAGSGQLEVHYQPIVSLPELHCTGVEAIVRWRHPERGLLLPQEFIPLAERDGAILGIGAFVLRRSCTDAVAWPDARPGTPMTVHVNISARELESDHFVDSVLWCLADSGLPASRLELELTETALVEDGPQIAHTLDALRRLGIKIAMDDFGTGYSSLAHLRDLPLDRIKIDRSFVAAALNDRQSLAVIKAVTQMGRDMNIPTLAEGVESREQLDLLRAIGCDAVQGYLIGRPARPQALAYPESGIRAA